MTPKNVSRFAHKIGVSSRGTLWVPGSLSVKSVATFTLRLDFPQLRIKGGDKTFQLSLFIHSLFRVKVEFALFF